MEIFDRENIDKLLEIRQICQYFFLSKVCAIQYVRVCMYVCYVCTYVFVYLCVSLCTYHSA